jgi:hypothetical protein
MIIQTHGSLSILIGEVPRHNILNSPSEQLWRKRRCFRQKSHLTNFVDWQMSGKRLWKGKYYVTEGTQAASLAKSEVNAEVKPVFIYPSFHTCNYEYFQVNSFLTSPFLVLSSFWNYFLLVFFAISAALSCPTFSYFFTSTCPVFVVGLW